MTTHNTTNAIRGRQRGEARRGEAEAEARRVKERQRGAKSSAYLIFS